MTTDAFGQTPSRVGIGWRWMRWKLHWLLMPGSPFMLRGWWDGIDLTLPRSGSAATAVYRVFPSPVIARWMSELLGQGMTVIDVGAHVGVYSLLAGRLVGRTGTVHAIEPQPDCIRFLALNAAANEMPHVKSHALAVGDRVGSTGLAIDRRHMSAVVSPLRLGAETVPLTTLSAFVEHERLGRADLVKLDAAGNEFVVLKGSERLLREGRIHAIILKLYHPAVIQERFGENAVLPTGSVEFIRRYGYSVVLPNGRAADAESLEAALMPDTYSLAALATLPEPSK